jgi:hypothetical protein
VDPTRDLLQVLDRRHQSRCDAGQLGAEVVALRGKVRLRRAQRQSERHEPLLRAVVEIPLDLTTRLVGRGDDPSPRGSQLGRAFRVRDRRCDEFRERGETRFGSQRHRPLGRTGRHDAPETTFDDDRASDRRSVASLVRGDADRVGSDREVVDPSGPS